VGRRNTTANWKVCAYSNTYQEPDLEKLSGKEETSDHGYILTNLMMMNGLHEQLSQVTTEWSELAVLNFSNFQPSVPEDLTVGVQLLDIDMGKHRELCPWSKYVL
jgi:hypothetical protein